MIRSQLSYYLTKVKDSQVFNTLEISGLDSSEIKISFSNEKENSLNNIFFAIDKDLLKELDEDNSLDKLSETLFQIILEENLKEDLK